MTEESALAYPVFKALNDFKIRIDDMMAIIEAANTITATQKIDLQETLKSFKNDINAAAKYGTVNGSKQPMNHYEKAYYEPTVAKVAANLSIATNSHPIKSDWYSQLLDVQGDITYMTFQLKEQFPEF